VAWIAMALCLFLPPLAGSAVPISVLIVLWLIFWDLSTTFNMRVMEIIPPTKREVSGGDTQVFP